ncbi:non-hydrolyzing UDP-N-acetylglucosamine 2-epimerase [Owenweeksia hongkongensis]|uniref:non-hydrolyzing UDP-N-acetylglucosamine 2-epimerase n=1 Tax=Owenweeksia hongkongensis TaxID=253245 RepID=UPI003A8CFCDD
MKIVTIVGARPQFIKAAAFSRKLSELTDWEEILVHTGQHYDSNMSEVFFEEMKIPKPSYHFEIHGMARDEMLEEMHTAIEKVIQKEQPDWVLVYGDTNSTLAGARAAKKHGIKLAHVEAGLRSYNLEMPEEHNRVETDQLSDVLFVPSQNAIDNLKKEGLEKGREIVNVGDIMYDAVKFYASNNADENESQPYALLTLHRAENTDNSTVLKRLLSTVNKINEQLPVVWPMHPRTKAKLRELEIPVEAKVIDPVGYLQMLPLIQNSKLVLTDSGGLQKEAFYLNKFCITLRKETEWTELVDLGVNRICGSDEDKVLEAFQYFTETPFTIKANPYGEGDTAEKIIDSLRLYSV